MAICRCKGSKCVCKLASGFGFEVTGTGTERNPYEVSQLALSLIGIDTGSADTTVTGTGPWTIQVDVGGSSLTQIIYEDSDSWEKPETGSVAHVVAIGGGGGGGAPSDNVRGASGGNGGAMSSFWTTLDSLPEVVDVHVGSGGQGAVAGVGTYGEDGGHTWFGAYILAGGGVGGRHQGTNVEATSPTVPGTVPEGGSGGWKSILDVGPTIIPAGIDPNSMGATGGGVGYSPSLGVGSSGGSRSVGSMGWTGMGGAGGVSFGSDGSNGQPYGGGGGGGSTAGTGPRGDGGDGAGGVVVVSVW